MTTRWPGVVTETGKFYADNRNAFALLMQSLKGEPVEVTVTVKRQQSPRKRGYYRAELVPAFRVYLEAQFRGLLDAFREHYGAFTDTEAHEVLVRAVMHLPTDEERVSTSIAAMDDHAYQEFLFRVQGFLTSIECPFQDADRDPIRRLQRRTA